jgi:hypothetical protein
MGRKIKAVKTSMVMFAPGFQQAFDEASENDLQCLTAVHRPMIVPPNPWLCPEGGGYLSNQQTKKIHLVKHWNRPEVLNALKNANLDIVLDAVNALQETPWRVNSRICACQHQILTNKFPDSDISDLFKGSCGGNDPAEMLKEERKNLKTKIRACLELAGPEINLETISNEELLTAISQDAIYFPYCSVETIMKRKAPYR